MNKKLLYTAPEAEAFVIQSEGVVCASTDSLAITPVDDGQDFPLVF